VQADDDKAPPFYTIGYLISYALILWLLVILFVLFSVSDAVIWPVSRETLFAGSAVSMAAIIGLGTFALRRHVDPRGEIYALPEGMNAALRRSTMRKQALLFLLGVLGLGWFLTLLLPPCALKHSCIDFSEASLIFALTRSVVPFLIIIGLGRSIANVAGYSILYFRTAPVGS
jgi:hypothetical protein